MFRNPCWEDSLHSLSETLYLQVDMLVGDIYGDRDYSSIGLSATTIASSFGKVVSQVRPAGILRTSAPMHCHRPATSSTIVHTMRAGCCRTGLHMALACPIFQTLVVPVMGLELFAASNNDYGNAPMLSDANMRTLGLPLHPLYCNINLQSQYRTSLILTPHTPCHLLPCRYMPQDRPAWRNCQSSALIGSINLCPRLHSPASVAGMALQVAITDTLMAGSGH